jgi:hypothetical protein
VYEEVDEEEEDGGEDEVDDKEPADNVPLIGKFKLVALLEVLPIALVFLDGLGGFGM